MGDLSSRIDSQDAELLRGSLNRRVRRCREEEVTPVRGRSCRLGDDPASARPPGEAATRFILQTQTQAGAVRCGPAPSGSEPGRGFCCGLFFPPRLNERGKLAECARPRLGLCGLAVCEPQEREPEGLKRLRSSGSGSPAAEAVLVTLCPGLMRRTRRFVRRSPLRVRKEKGKKKPKLLKRSTFLSSLPPHAPCVLSFSPHSALSKLKKKKSHAICCVSPLGC